MNDKFDELAKNLAQSVTRRGALKQFSLGLAGAVLASLGLANKAEAEWKSKNCYDTCYRHCVRQQGGDPTGCGIFCGSKCHPPIP